MTNCDLPRGLQQLACDELLYPSGQMNRAVFIERTSMHAAEAELSTAKQDKAVRQAAGHDRSKGQAGRQAGKPPKLNKHSHSVVSVSERQQATAKQFTTTKQNNRQKNGQEARKRSARRRRAASERRS
jgi:hypothetical protein